MKTFSKHRNRERGSLLIVAMVLCAVIAISLGSYLQLARTNLTISNRALYNNAAMNLAENGLEEAMHSINKMVADSSYAWPGWTISGSDAYRVLPESGTYSFDQNTTGTVKVYVIGYAGAAPKIVTRSKVNVGGTTGRPVEKWVEVQLRKTSIFANGLVAKTSITFSGNGASIDSWNSDPDNDPLTPPIPYSASVRDDNGTVGSISISVNSIAVNNADIWGYAATGGAQPAVGPNGLIGPFGTASGAVNPNHVKTDFTANFDPKYAPTNAAIALGTINNTLNLPRTGDVPDGAGVYYYTASQINFNNKTLAIKKRVSTEDSPNVVLTLTNTTSSIDIGGGSGQLTVENGASLQIYAAGDIKIAGNGIMNGGTTAATANQPQKLQIYGTKTSGVQDIQIAGNGVLSAILYAPQGSVKINGNGDVCGSVVCNDATLVGNAAFHYDESLANFGGNNPYRVSKWTELLSASSRNAYSTQLTF